MSEDSPEKECSCQVCQDERRWRKDLNISTPEAEAAFEEMLIKLEAAETDATWAHEVFTGRWPNSVEILESGLEVARRIAGNGRLN